MVHLEVHSMHGVECQPEKKPSQINNLATLSRRLTAPCVHLGDYFKWWRNTEPNPRPSMRFFRKALILRALASIKWPVCIVKTPGPVGAGLR